jgi:PAS domain S-box-containing protein
LAALALLFASPERGLIKDLTGSGAGSITSRRLIPFAFAAPIVLGWLRLLGARKGAYTVEFGVSILVLSIIVCFVFLIWYNTRLLNRREEAQRKAQKALSENERTIGLLIGSIRDYAIFMVDPAGRIKSWNPGAQAIKGYTADEVIGQPISIFYTSEELERNEPVYNLHMAEKNGSYHSEGWRVRKNGSRFWADIVFTAVYDSDHRLQGFAKITRDMSEQKKANEMIRYQARLMEDVSDAIISTDPEFRTVSWNKATEKLYGYSLAEAAGQDLGDLLRSPTDPSIRHAIREHLREHGYWHGELVYHTKKNVALNVLVSISAIRDEQNTVTGYVVVCRDITERLRAEQRLIKFNEELSLQVNEKTADLRALASHLQDVREEERADMAREIHDELGQQLTGLKMDMAWVDEQLAEEGRAVLRQRVADTLQLLDHTIMTVRKIAAELRPGILDDLGLVAAVEWQAEEFEKRSGIRARFLAGMPGRRYPSAMSIGLFRICQEALTNVARHSGAKHVEIFLGYEEDQIVLRVKDDGRGLPAAQKGGRKTLGVLGMKERALMMGGTVEVSGEAGKGVTLIVSVPMSAAEKT